jgi:nicotinamide mononucleotide transporter PnuC
VWSWSLGIVGAIILLILFTIKGTYSLVLLQVVYVVFFSYGWYQWTHKNSDSQNIVRWMKLKDYLRYGAVLIALCIFCLLFNYATGSENIVSVGILTGITFTAIIMTIEKFMENWIVWIVSDLYFVVVMYQEGLYGQVIQNIIFFITAVYGFYFWYKNSKHSV